ncbi:MAG: RidA family protein [Sphingomonadales bacterium]
MRQKISSGSPFEEKAGYSRAVVDGDWIYVSGTVGVDPDTKQLPDSALDQAYNIFRIIEDTLGQAGATLEDVVRNRVFVTDMAHLGDVVQVLGEKFGAIRPANTTLICQIPVPGAKVEIEVTARR